ncbi:MAG: hypothetical protein HYY85_03370 [Deltaproteobacteria bacterium]|nr:hypothetical protein [Deltaproteobacteria bacterium]
MADRILIVDDDPDMQFVLGEALRQAGYQVEAATSAEAGLEALRARPTELPGAARPGGRGPPAPGAPGRAV